MFLVWSVIRLWEGCRESRSCSRDTHPKSCITKYTSIRIWTWWTVLRKFWHCCPPFLQRALRSFCVRTFCSRSFWYKNRKLVNFCTRHAQNSPIFQNLLVQNSPIFENSLIFENSPIFMVAAADFSTHRSKLWWWVKCSMVWLVCSLVVKSC